METALIIVDMQNAFCHPNGSFSKRKYNILNLDNVININTQLIDFARKNNWLVIYTRLAYQPDYRDAGLLVSRHPEIRKIGAYIEGSFDSEIFERLRPRRQDVIIIKKRYDSFINTNLEKVLRQNKTKHIIVGGLLTNICVESTVRSAFDRDFEVTLVQDATSTYSLEAYKTSLDTMRRHFAEVCSFEEFKSKTLSHSTSG